MAIRPLTAVLPAALSILLAACATDATTEPETLQQWSGRHFYPPELCLGIYAGRYERTPDYWRIRRWCDKREMQSDLFL